MTVRTSLSLLLVATLVFATAHGQAPLYYSNQNQYFLHGLAWAGHGNLREDWLVSTLDPTPVFTALVALTATCVPAWFFHLEYAILLGIYAAAMLGVFTALVGKDTASRTWPIFAAAFVVLHSAAARWLGYRLLGLDYLWYFQAGVAGQYILGAMFQPSTFGVFLVVAVALFLWDRTVPAIFLLAVAATCHSTYLLPAALLTGGFLASLITAGQPGRAVRMGLLALLLVLPVTLHVALMFGPTSATEFAEAQNILVNVRIPHHARVDLWLDPIAGLQLGWIAVGIVLARHTRLFLVLAIPFGLMLFLTLVQAVTGNHTLALLFPWRVSSVLVPIATTVVLSRLAALTARFAQGTTARALAAVVVLAAMAGSVWIMAERLAYRSSDEELPLLEFVRENQRAGDVYFVPVQIPELARMTRGSSSSDFKQPAEKQRDARLIPVDLQRFRLLTGAPIFVDFKAIPYKDVEVLEWYRRLKLAEYVQDRIAAGDIGKALARLREEGVTHLVLPSALNPGLRDIYADRHYRIFKVE